MQRKPKFAVALLSTAAFSIAGLMATPGFAKPKKHNDAQHQQFESGHHTMALGIINKALAGHKKLQLTETQKKKIEKIIKKNREQIRHTLNAKQISQIKSFYKHKARDWRKSNKKRMAKHNKAKHRHHSRRKTRGHNNKFHAKHWEKQHNNRMAKRDRFTNTHKNGHRWSHGNRGAWASASFSHNPPAWRFNHKRHANHRGHYYGQFGPQFRGQAGYGHHNRHYARRGHNPRQSGNARIRKQWQEFQQFKQFLRWEHQVQNQQNRSNHRR